MFEIGPSLREARERRGLGYTQVELDTAIRSRYIRALEEEDFGILPGPTYTKGFLRAYADYLGLDGQLFVDEFNSRHHDPRREFDQPIASRPRSRPQQRRRRRESHLALIVLAAIVAVTSMIFLVALKRPSNTAPPLTTPLSTNTTKTTEGTDSTTGQQSTGTETSTGTTKKAPVAHKEFTVLLTASASCWVTLHTGAPDGPNVTSTHGTDVGDYEINPAIDSTVEFKSKKPVYMTVGAPGSLTIAIDGKDTPLPDGVGAGTVVRITSKGIAAA